MKPVIRLSILFQGQKASRYMREIHTDHHPQTFFLQSLDWSFEPWTQQIPSVNIWSTDTTNPHIFEVISEHLKSMTPIESGLWSSLAVIIVVSLLSIPICCFCLCPSVLKACMPTCCSNCLFKTINDQIFSHRELTMALALLHPQNDPSAPAAENVNLPLNPMIAPEQTESN
jgi:hypothetical protein